MSARFAHGDRVASEATECSEPVVGEMRTGIQGWTGYLLMQWAGSTFTVPGWQMILTRFNHVSCLHYTKARLLYRWKILKKDYAAYLYFRNKSGWGWDGIYNRPIAPSDSAWFKSWQITIANITTSFSFTLETFRDFSVKTLQQVCTPSPLVHPGTTKELVHPRRFPLQARES